MYPRTAEKFEQNFWNDNTYKTVILPPDRNLPKELKYGLSEETQAIALDLRQTSEWCADTSTYSSSTAAYDAQLDVECTICMMDIDSLFMNKCMHKYCTSCAKHLKGDKEQFQCCICVPPGTDIDKKWAEHKAYYVNKTEAD